MDQQKRMLLALGLSFGLTLVYVTFFVKPQEEQAPPPQQTTAAAPDAGVAAPVAQPAPVPEVKPGEPEQAPAPEIKQVTAHRQQVHYRFSTQGAGLTQAELQGAKMRQAQDLSFSEGFKKLFGGDVPPPGQMDLAVPAPNQPLPLALSIEGSAPLAADVPYQVEESLGKLEFKTRSGSWEVIKRLTFAQEGFELGYQIEITNVGSALAQGELGLHYALAIDPTKEHEPSMFGGLGNQARVTCLAQEELHHLVPDGEKKEEFQGPIRYFGIDQSYFLAAIYPLQQAREGRCVLTAAPTSRRVDTFFPLSVAPGQTVTLPFGVFIGPKDAELLAMVPTAPTAGAEAGGTPGTGTGYRPMLEKSVDFGILEVICRLLLSIMKFFHSVTGNWGVAIILLTVLVKLVLLPLTHKSMVSAEQMKKLQPKMEEIRKKFAQDRDKQNMEMMKLYQEAKVNPLGGCLPMLFQLPVWAALFTTLRTSYELYREPFFGPLWSDLTAKDPIYFLPLALGVTMVITQKLQPQMMDATQAKIMTYFMPIFFTFIMLQYPSGLTLYIFVNNILSIAQQYGLRKYLERKGLAEPSTKPDKKVGAGQRLSAKGRTR